MYSRCLSDRFVFSGGWAHAQPGDEWGAFEEDDWRGETGAGTSSVIPETRGVRVEDEEEAFSRPRDQGVGGDAVPGLLGGARFGKFAQEVEDVEAVAGEGGVGDEVPDEAANSAGR